MRIRHICIPYMRVLSKYLRYNICISYRLGMYFVKNHCCKATGVGILKGRVIEVCSGCQNLELGHVLICWHARCHPEGMKLGASCSGAIRVSKRLFNLLSKVFKGFKGGGAFALPCSTLDWTVFAVSRWSSWICQLQAWGLSLLWRLVPEWPRNTSESRFPQKPRNSDFILFLKQRWNISEIQFLGFLRNLESIPFLNDLGTLWKFGFLDFLDSSETQNPKHRN